YELLNMERVERFHVRALLADPVGTTRDSVGGGAAAGGSHDFRGASEASGFHPQLPEIDSCVELFPTAEFQEREIYDMFG
ncbi:NADH-quinone oxidoreductase subunit C, partial [Salmonella sp. SAL4443]|uniref:NADH-quinone oxidoreductase subunit C n=1 Tax=Salmonella sp. SAL4443 TaxID=3159898 RepID=UPI003979DFD1